MKKIKEGKDKDWFDEECKAALEKRKEARINWCREDTEKNKEVYNQMAKAVRQICRKKKREYWEAKIESIENCFVNIVI